jgi:putative spermidine/putrescine transport system substrate-binding protein
VLAYDGDKFKDGPKSWADFWDVAKFPGKRGAYKDARIMLEVALMADGVKKEDIYKVLSEEAGFDRAFKKLDELKPHILWAESAAEGVQRLLAGDVAMIVNFNARVSGAAAENKRNLVIGWDSGFWVGTDYWVQIANGPNPGPAAKLLEFYSRPATQAALVETLSYGVPTLAAYDLMPAEIKNSLPTSPDTWALLKRRALTVWLRAKPEEHWNRVVQQGDRRPMADNPQAMAELRRLLAAREPLYSQAHLTVDTSQGETSTVEAVEKLLPSRPAVL